MASRSPVSVALALALAFSPTLPALAQGSSAPGGDNAFVETDQGVARGTAGPATFTFLGIPYAKPPVGELRWQPPQPRGPWTGILDATKFGNHCLQPGPASTQTNASEDCLFLNVYGPTRRTIESSFQINRWNVRHPVMVWIYGGANASGASEFYGPTPLVETGGVIVVTLNYRVGPFGFLAHPALDAEGHPAVNYGIMDQQLALKWVRTNIARFGGDPLNVTVFGESAGGLDVTTHLVSPLSAGLFDRVIIESGAYQLNTPSLAASEALGVRFANNVGCTDQSAACLRSTSAADVLANAGAVNTPSSSYNQSTVDGRVLVETQLSALSAGRINRVPVVQGNNTNEGRIFTSPTLTAAGYQATLAAFAAGVGKTLDQALAAYPLSDYPSPFEAASAALGDFAFACSAARSNKLLSRFVRTYAYEFADPNAGPLGATHGAELKYLFTLSGVGGSTDGGPGTLPVASQLLALVMRAYWTDFAWSGNPNLVILPHWPPFPNTIELLAPPLPSHESLDAFNAEHKCAFWE